MNDEGKQRRRLETGTLARVAVFTALIAPVLLLILQTYLAARGAGG